MGRDDDNYSQDTSIGEIRGAGGGQHRDGGTIERDCNDRTSRPGRVPGSEGKREAGPGRKPAAERS